MKELEGRPTLGWKEGKLIKFARPHRPQVDATLVQKCRCAAALRCTFTLRSALPCWSLCRPLQPRACTTSACAAGSSWVARARQVERGR